MAKGCTVYQTLTLQLHKPKVSIPRMYINKAPFRVNDYLSDGGPPLFEIHEMVYCIQFTVTLIRIQPGY